jgi:hypothetical protein
LAAQGLQPFFAAHGLHPFFAAHGLQPRFGAHGLHAANAAPAMLAPAMPTPTAIASGITVLVSILALNGFIKSSIDCHTPAKARFICFPQGR